MKILIWVQKSEAISGNITNYAFTRPYHDRNDEWLSVQISQDEFARLEDNKYTKPTKPKMGMNIRGGDFSQWYEGLSPIEKHEYNRQFNLDS